MRHWAAKHINQQEGLEQVQQLSPSVLAEIVGRAIRSVKENKVFAQKLRTCDIIANYNLMVSDAELEPDSHVCKDVLHGIVSLYINVRSFSYAKDIIQ